MLITENEAQCALYAIGSNGRVVLNTLPRQGRACCMLEEAPGAAIGMLA